MTVTRILSVIGFIFCHLQEPRLIVLLLINKCIKIILGYTVLTFSLVKYLRIKSSKEPLLDAKKIA